MPRVNPDGILSKLLSRITTGKLWECWSWNGGHGNGYPYWYDMKRKKTFRVTRSLYVLLYGAVKKDILICHHCDNPGCVNPSHLFAGTNSDNMKDAWNKGRLPLAKHWAGYNQYRRSLKCCKRGHLYKGNNLIVIRDKNRPRPYRRCRTCFNMMRRLAHAKS